MWYPRSCVREAWNDTASETKKAKKYGGDVKSSVLVLLYPKVPTIDGKKLLKDSAVMRLIIKPINMYSLGSMSACLSPHHTESASSSMMPAFSLRMRHSCEMHKCNLISISSVNGGLRMSVQCKTYRV